ncbi:MAG: transposase, partial [Methanosarcinales archaeon]|nr:transposase [Methanosarcinales archaeon]
MQKIKKTNENEITTKDNKKKRNKGESSTKRGKGRPKGSKNKNKADVKLSSYLCTIQSILGEMLKIIGSTIPITYVVLDGAFGHNKALQMVRQCNLHIISKLQYNSALY